MSKWQKEEIFIVGKTYPVPEGHQLDTVCTGGITRDGRWIRLWPVIYRYLERDQKYRIYSWIEAKITKSSKDPRHETYSPREDSIKTIEEINNWGEKKRIILPLATNYFEALNEINRADPMAISMGLIEVEYLGFFWEETERNWSKEQLEIMSQKTMLGPDRKPLEKIPYKLKLHFRCKNNPTCETHTRTIFCWEHNQTFRSWRNMKKYKDEVEVLEAMKESFEKKLFNNDRDLFLEMGTLRNHPTTWILGGMFYPPKNTPIQEKLFEK